MQNHGITEQAMDIYLTRRAHSENPAGEDQQILDIYGSECCVVFTDLCNFTEFTSRFGILAFLQKMKAFREVFSEQVKRYAGEVLKTEGDSMLVLFESPVQAVCALRNTHFLLHQYNKKAGEPQQIRLCAGIGFGLVLRIGDKDVFGDAVNKASKLGEDIAGAFEILMTPDAFAVLQGFHAVFCEDEVTGIEYYKLDITREEGYGI